MTKQHRTRDEQKLWDALVVQMVRKCFAFDVEDSAQGCAHLVREIADAVIRERRQSIKSDN